MRSKVNTALVECLFGAHQELVLLFANGSEKESLGGKQMSNKQLRNYLILMVAVIVGILFLYYIVSPYQNCIRDIEADRASQFVLCVENTSW